MSASKKGPMKPRWPHSVDLSARFAAVLFLVELLDAIIPIRLDQFGIRPRELEGLVGVIVSPALHGGFGHLFSNLLALWALMTLLFADRGYRPVRAFVSIWIGSGMGVWLIGRGADRWTGVGVTHIGASSLVYGLVVYLALSGALMRRWRNVLVSILVFIAFGSILHGVLPGQAGVSWEGHLSGAISGFVAAVVLHRGR